VRTRTIDIVICGAGPVGAACALFLAERGVAASRLVLVDARTPAEAARDERMIAISQGSATLLARIGAWNGGIDAVATSIDTVHISQRGRFGRTVIDRADYGTPALGYVVRHGDITPVLDRVLAARGIEVARPRRVAAVTTLDDRLRVAMISDDEQFDARYVIHAEGGLFDAQEVRAIHRDYGQTALTSFVTLAAPPGDALTHTAFERFTPHGPLALLPARANGVAGYSLVWCDEPDAARARLERDDEAFLAELQQAFGDRLGRFASATPRRAFPLGLNAHATTARAEAEHAASFAIGNAAQTLHPVAGQGLNLGLRDAFVLAQSLAIADRDPAIDAPTLVARHEAARRLDRSVTMDLTDLMPRVFSRAFAPVARGRGLALALLDVATPLRGVFARQMMNGRR